MIRQMLRFALCVVIGVAVTRGALGQACDAEWTPELFTLEGLDERVTCWATWDDGTGERLYAGGWFRKAGSGFASYVASWDGTRWHPVGESGLRGPGVDRIVHAMAVFDDGSGPALYVGGGFNFAGSARAENIARWDGERWSALVGPGGEGLDGDVYALAVHNDGTGPALYAGGTFRQADGVEVNNIARWDGHRWTPLGSGSLAGTTSQVLAIESFGGDLYIGGAFAEAGGVFVNQIARWDGARWSALPGQVGGGGTQVGLNSRVNGLAVFDDGRGQALYAVGRFDRVEGGPDARSVARWDGTRWEAVGADGSISGAIQTARVFDDGTGPALYVGGSEIMVASEFRVMGRWDGNAWSVVRGIDGNDIDRTVYALGEYDDGSGSALYAGGDFQRVADTRALFAARWSAVDGWGELSPPTGLGYLFDVTKLFVFDDGDGEALYASSRTIDPEGLFASPISRWTGAGWEELSSDDGLRNLSPAALTVFDDGLRVSLYAGGDFRDPSVPGRGGRLARWTGERWIPMIGPGGDGLSSGTVLAADTYNDGAGDAIYIGGTFLEADDQEVNRIARWDGTAYSGLGDPDNMGVNDRVLALAVWDDGSGEALYVGGEFTLAGLDPVSGVARWDGQNWSALAGPGGEGVDGSVHAFAIHDDGTGAALYVGGEFESAGGVLANNIARWDGSRWSAIEVTIGTVVEVGVNGTVHALLSRIDDGEPGLYVGGRFTMAGPLPAQFVARLGDGPSWRRLSGPDGDGTDQRVESLATVNEATGAALYAGGPFISAGGVLSQSIARWGCQGCQADFDGDGSLTIFDFLAFQTAFDAMDARADFDHDGRFTIFDFLAFQTAFGAGCP